MKLYDVAEQQYVVVLADGKAEMVDTIHDDTSDDYDLEFERGTTLLNLKEQRHTAYEPLNQIESAEDEIKYIRVFSGTRDGEDVTVFVPSYWEKILELNESEIDEIIREGIESPEMSESTFYYGISAKLIDGVLDFWEPGYNYDDFGFWKGLWPDDYYNYDTPEFIRAVRSYDRLRREEDGAEDEASEDEGGEDEMEGIAMSRFEYKGYIADTDGLGRPYIHNTASSYGEDSDHILVYIDEERQEEQIRAIIDARIESGQDCRRACIGPDGEIRLG